MAACYHWTLAVVVMLSVPLATTDDVLLYSNGGGFGKHAGLYGGPLVRDNNGKIQVQEDIKAHCYSSGKGVKSNIKIKSISVDDMNRTVYLWESSDSPAETTLLRGTTCLLTQTCKNSSITVVFENFRDRIYQIGPFAALQNQLYFVAMKKIPSPTGGRKLRSYEIRKVNFGKSDCKARNFPIESSSPFSVDDCSDSVGMLLKEFAEEDLTTLDHLLVFNDNGAIRFAVVMQSVTSRPKEKINVILLVTTEHAGDLANPVDEIADISSEFISFYKSSTGGLAYRGGQLCWAPLDRIRCMAYQDGDATDKRDVLKAGESKSSMACAGPGSDHLLANITTGIAITKAEEGHLEVTFGCLAVPNVVEASGGAGVVSIKNGKRDVRPLYANDTKMFGESMATATYCLDGDFRYDINSASSVSAFMIFVHSLFLFILTIFCFH